jgi:hypothetical protein
LKTLHLLRYTFAFEASRAFAARYVSKARKALYLKGFEEKLKNLNERFE